MPHFKRQPGLCPQQIDGKYSSRVLLKAADKALYLLCKTRPLFLCHLMHNVSHVVQILFSELP
ncbi:hypothetical protein D3C80_1718250 [compost metagenome]